MWKRAVKLPQVTMQLKSITISLFNLRYSFWKGFPYTFYVLWKDRTRAMYSHVWLASREQESSKEASGLITQQHTTAQRLTGQDNILREAGIKKKEKSSRRGFAPIKICLCINQIGLREGRRARAWFIYATFQPTTGIQTWGLITPSSDARTRVPILRSRGTNLFIIIIMSVYIYLAIVYAGECWADYLPEPAGRLQTLRLSMLHNKRPNQ